MKHRASPLAHLALSEHHLMYGSTNDEPIRKIKHQL